MPVCDGPGRIPKLLFSHAQLKLHELNGQTRDRLHYLCSENKGADRLICVFVFASAKSRFSHDTSHKLCT